MNTLLIPFAANNVNMSPSVHVFGTLSMTGLAGFGHAAIRLISDIVKTPLVDQGVALALTEHHYFPHYQRPSWSKRTSYAKTVAGAPTQEFRIGCLSGFVILRFEATDAHLISIQRNLSLIAHNLAKLRFAGGQFFPDPHGVRLFENDPEGVLALAKVPYDARVYVDQTHLIQHYAACHAMSDLDALMALINLKYSAEHLTAVPEATESDPIQPHTALDLELELEAAFNELDEQLEDAFDFSIFDADDDQWGDVDGRTLLAQEGWIDQYYGRLIPVDIGYRLLEAPQPRRHRYSDEHPYPHAYAEPVTGLARLQIVASCRKHQAPIFWKHTDMTPFLIVKGCSQ